MNRVRGTAVAVVVVIATAVIAGCSDRSPGVVTGRWMTTVGGTQHYWVKVRHAGGGETTESVPSPDYYSCAPGASWPGCLS